MVTPAPGSPDEDVSPGALRPHDRTSLEASLAEVLRAAASEVAATAPEPAPVVAPSPARPGPIHARLPGSASDVGWSAEASIGETAAIATTAGVDSGAGVGTTTTDSGAGAGQRPYGAIPSNLRLLPPPVKSAPAPPEPAPPEAAHAPESAPAALGSPVGLGAPTGIVSLAAPIWRPEDDDILPLHRHHRRGGGTGASPDAGPTPMRHRISLRGGSSTAGAAPVESGTTPAPQPSRMSMRHRIGRRSASSGADDEMEPVTPPASPAEHRSLRQRLNGQHVSR